MLTVEYKETINNGNQGKLNVYLLGSYEPTILGAKLPSYRQAFGYFLHLHNVERLTVRDSSRKAIELVIVFWNKSGIPVRATKHCIDKLEALLLNVKASKSIRIGTPLVTS